MRIGIGCRLLMLLVPVGLFAEPAWSADESKWSVSKPPVSVESRDVTINVREGTWMSLDVAPDGETIVFDLLGDIYQMPFAGGKATALRSGHAWEMQPRFSPDGRSIAFTSDIEGGDNIFTLDLASGFTRQITNESFRLLNNPGWSPDGQYIAARKHFTTSRSLGTGEIWLYHALSGMKSKGVPVVERPGASYQKELGEPVFAPDGSGIYYTQNSTPGNTFIYHQDSNQEVFRINMVDLKTNERIKVAGGPGGAVRPTPSPDGKYLAYIKRVRAISRLFLMDLESGVETMLPVTVDQDMQETWAVHGLYPNMDWTPDGRQLVYWAQGKLWRFDVVKNLAHNIPFEIADTRSIYPAPRVQVDVAPKMFSARMVRFASFSPAGDAVVFESLGQLFIKVGDRDAKPLTKSSPRGEKSQKEKGFEFSPVWSLDGKQVYFLRWHDQKLGSIHSVTRTGREKQLSREKGQFAELSLSADGESLVYRKLAAASLRNPGWTKDAGIYRMDIATGDTHFVTARGESPTISQDGRVTFQERKRSSGRDSSNANTRLVSVSLSGKDERALVEGEFISEFALSPDGRAVAFIENHHVFVSLLPATGNTIQIGRQQSNLPTVRLSKYGGMYLRWSTDSTRLSWSTGPELKTVVVRDALFPAISDADAGHEKETVMDDKFETDIVNLSQQFKSAAPDHVLAIKGARIITMDAGKRVIENGTVLMSENRIIEVGAASDIQIPSDALVMDAAGKTIMPGMIDAHAHGAYGSGQIIPQQNWNSLAHLALGVTTVHNPSSSAHQAFAAAEYARAGAILSPRIFSTGEIVYGAMSTYWAPIESLEDALAQVNRLKSQGAFSIKNYNQPRREQRQQVIEATRLAGLMTVAEGGSLYHMDMNLIADGITGIEHNIPLMKMYDDVTQFWRQSDAGYTPTLVVTFGGLTSEDYYYQTTDVWRHPILANFVPPAVLQPRSVRRPMAPESDYKDDDAAAVAKVLSEAGVTVNTGAHGQREGLATHWEMWSFVRGGMSPMQALSAATINPATYLGMDKDLGSIEAGKLADLVILNENPLESIENSDKLSHVVLNGRIYQAGTLAEEITGDKKLIPFWWQQSPQGLIR